MGHMSIETTEGSEICWRGGRMGHNVYRDNGRIRDLLA
jgi:hypothetical protein